MRGSFLSHKRTNSKAPRITQPPLHSSLHHNSIIKQTSSISHLPYTTVKYVPCPTLPYDSKLNPPTSASDFFYPSIPELTFRDPANVVFQLLSETSCQVTGGTSTTSSRAVATVISKAVMEVVSRAESMEVHLALFPFEPWIFEYS